VDARPEDVDGLVNFVRNIEGVRAGILFREFGGSRVKISMRSMGGVNSSKILAGFGGGGHVGAAGATVDGDLESIQAEVVRETEEALAAEVKG
jgi:phosphoesterase RecJ-like protein